VKIQIEAPEPHSNQQLVLDSAARFNVLACGRRFGKTVIGMDRAVSTAINKQYLGWFAPTYKLLGDAWRLLESQLAPLIVAKDVSDKRIELIGGGRIEGWSLDNPDAGRGRAYHRVVIDEAAMVKDLEHAWQQAIRPTLSDYRGDAWFLSTPKGVASYFYTLFQRGIDPLKPRWKSWQMPTLSNPYIEADEIDEAREDLTDLAFAQEYLAQFVNWAGTVFRRIAEACTNAAPGPAVMIGVDWGRTGDYTVFVALSAAGEVCAIDRFRGMEYAMQRDRLRAFWETTTAKRAFIIAEMNSMGAPVVEQLQIDKLPVRGFTTTNQSKSAIILSLALGFERGVVKIPYDPILIGELQAFEGKQLAGGLMRYSAPAGLHDDVVMALAIGWAGLLLPTGGTQYAVPGGGVSRTYHGDLQVSPI
jgi:Terminase large subunit, T4likevirus-type, N-terminal